MKSMISRSLVVFLCLLTVFSYGQTVEVVDKSDNPNKGISPNDFHYIESAYKIQKDQYIATFNGFVVNSGESILPNLFNLFWRNANELGANTFRVEDVYYGNDTISIDVSVYHLKDSLLEDMIELYPTNMVYVIGDIDRNQKPKRIKFNNEKIELAPLEYIAYQNKIGEKAILSIGGLLGAKAWIKGKENKLPRYFSLSGFGVGPGINPNRGISVNFNTGRIYPVDINFGQFLTNVLAEKK